MSARALARPTPAYFRAVDELRPNSDQWKAFESTGHCVVLAGPGSGKTKALTTKIVRLLIEDVSQPRGLACLTYSTECVRELRRRLDRLGVSETRSVFVGTIHSFCLQHIVLPFARLAKLSLPTPLQVASSAEQDSTFGEAVTQVFGPSAPADVWRVPMERHRRSYLDRDHDDWTTEPELAELVTAYERELRSRGMIDFDDIVLLGVQLIETHPWIRQAVRARFPVLAVDEYQDLGVALHRIVENLCFTTGVRLFAVGDPDQSIYGFTGAKPELLRELAARPDVEVVTLRMNYRSGTTIVRAAEIALGESRGYSAHGAKIGTVDFHERPEGLADQASFIGEVLIPDLISRLPGLVLGNIAVLFRDKRDGDIIATAAEAAGLSVIRLDKGAPYPKKPITRFIEDCAAWCAGGWRNGTPRLSELIGSWLRLSNRERREARGAVLRLALVRFLLQNRNPGATMAAWLSKFSAACLNQVVEKPHLRDELLALQILQKAVTTGVGRTWTVASFGGQRGSPDRLTLLTFHSAKGLEFRAVILMGLDQGRLPYFGATEEQKADDRRLFYVAVTRAQDEVHLTYSGWTQNKYGKIFRNGPSEFLTELRERLREE